MNFLQTMFFILIVGSFFLGVGAAAIGDSCPYPSALKTKYDFNWRSKSNEWSNTAATTEYMMLALSWSPTYCASLSQSARDKSFQCLHSQTFGLIVHGLWPQAAKGSAVRAHPRNCRDEPQLNGTFVKRFFCMMPDEELMQAEWEKHGTCYYQRESEYYLATEKLYQSLRFPSANIMESSNAGIIKDAILALNAPSLIASAVRIDMTNLSRLKEVKICYDLNFRYTSCT